MSENDERTEIQAYAMKFEVKVTLNARKDIQYFRAYEQRIISQGIRTHLTHDADGETGKRKVLDPNELATWELRIDDYRIFYDIEDTTVYVVAVGYKVHNDLYIQGKKVEL